MTRALAAFVALAALASRAHAQPPPSPDAAYLAGRAHVVAGDKASDAGDYRAAADEYRAAYQLLPHPDLLFNIAQSYRLAGDRRAAIEHYRRYLAVVSSGPAADKAREHLATLEKEEPAVDEVDPVERAAPRPLPPAPSPSPAPVGQSPVDDEARAPRWLAPVVTGAGALMAASGAVLWFSAGRTFDRLDDSCAPACDPAEWSGARRRERVGVALGVTGGAVAIAGAALWIVSARLTF